MFSMSGETPMLKSFPSSSAFQPPVSRDKSSSSGSSSLFSPGHNIFPRMSPSSSRSSPSPVAIREKTDENSNSDLRLQVSSPDEASSRNGDDDLDDRSPKRE